MPWLHSMCSFHQHQTTLPLSIHSSICNWNRVSQHFWLKFALNCTWWIFLNFFFRNEKVNIDVFCYSRKDESRIYSHLSWLQKDDYLHADRVHDASMSRICGTKILLAVCRLILDSVIIVFYIILIVTLSESWCCSDVACEDVASLFTQKTNPQMAKSVV